VESYSLPYNKRVFWFWSV